MPRADEEVALTDHYDGRREAARNVKSEDVRNAALLAVPSSRFITS
jgi:hypothetical protein